MMSISSRGVFCWSCRLVWANSWVGGCVWSADTVTSVGHLTVNTFWEHDIIGLVLGDGLLHTKIPLSIYYVIHYHSSIEPSLRPPNMQSLDTQTINHGSPMCGYIGIIVIQCFFYQHCQCWNILLTYITINKKGSWALVKDPSKNHFKSFTIFHISIQYILHNHWKP